MRKKIRIFILFICTFILLGCTVKSNNELLQIRKLSKSEDSIRMYSDNYKLIYLTSDSSAYVFYYKDDKITDFKMYYSTYSSDISSQLLDTYKEQFKNEEGVENIYNDEEFIIVDYSEEYVNNMYSNSTIDDIIDMIDYINEE